jgi:hypothetical protein
MNVPEPFACILSEFLRLHFSVFWHFILCYHFNHFLQDGRVKLVLKRNKVFVESDFPMVLRELLRDPTIAQARVTKDAENLDEHGFIT